MQRDVQIIGTYLFQPHAFSNYCDWNLGSDTKRASCLRPFLYLCSLSLVPCCAVLCFYYLYHMTFDYQRERKIGISTFSCCRAINPTSRGNSALLSSRCLDNRLALACRAVCREGSGATVAPIRFHATFPSLSSSLRPGKRNSRLSCGHAKWIFFDPTYIAKTQDYISEGKPTTGCFGTFWTIACSRSILLRPSL